MKSTIQAMVFSLVIHLILIGGGFGYLEYERKQKLKQGYYASEYGLQIAGGTVTLTLIITFIALAVLYLVVKRIIKLIFN